MALTRMKYTPETGLKDKEKFPATPVSEDAAREQFQRLFDQVKTQVNALMAALESAQNDSSGAKQIGCETVSYLEDSGTTVWSKLQALSAKINEAVTAGLELSEVIGAGSIVSGMLAGGAVTAEKLADGAVTADKLAGGAVTEEKLGVIQQLTLGLRTDLGAGRADSLTYDATARMVKLNVGGITAAQLAPVVYGTASTITGSYPAGTLYVQYVE